MADSAGPGRRAPAGQDEQGAVNEVRLRGRLAALPEERQLPSGDAVCTWRLVVARPPGRPREGVRPVTVDALDCAAWTAGVRRRARALRVGDVVEVRGALRRRFWRGGGGPVSRTEVEVLSVQRVARAAPAGPAARRRPRRQVPGEDEAPAQASS